MSFLEKLLLFDLVTRHCDDDCDDWPYSDPVAFDAVSSSVVSDVFSIPEEAEMVCNSLSKRYTEHLIVQPVFFDGCNRLFYVVVFA